MTGGDFELELALSWRRGAEYALSARFLRPDANEEYRTADPATFTLDAEALLRASRNPEAYGAELAKLIFSAVGTRDALVKARAAARQQNLPLRVRLSVGQDAPALHSVRWELLPDPETRERLLLQPDVLFSRFLASQDWRPLPARPRGRLRALVAVANPMDLGEWKPGGRALAPIRADAEVTRAREALAGFEVEVLSAPGTVTLESLGERLREGFDVLYLVCHGALVEGAPRLWLENASGKSVLAEGRDLVERVQDAVRRPRLVLLASCESAGTGAIADDGAFGALGPRLARAGVPAVVAMNGEITMQSMAMFLPEFFRELAADGRVDRAMAVARGRLAGRPDWWMPALFMRLRNGRLWYEQGFSAADGGFDKWESLVSDLRHGNCVPILGPGVDEPLLGSLRDVARRWSDQYDFPLAPHSREDLAQVAQYLSYRQTASFPRTQLGEVLKRHVREAFQAELPAELLARRPADVTLDDLLSAAGAAFRKSAAGANDVHARLARLPVELYVTANRDNLLRDALVEAGKEPQIALVRWREGFAWPRGAPDAGADLKPTEQRPVVLHLFGNVQWPDTLVLTEDDYFDFLLELARSQHRGGGLLAPPPGATPAPQRAAIPEWIAARLAASGLLFLGFELEDWEFRILFRAILMQEGSVLGEEHTRLAVQLNPGEDRALEPVGARKYLERYFQKSRSYAIYWGPAEAFMADLASRWSAS